jgi:hypothetical protein
VPLTNGRLVSPVRPWSDLRPAGTPRL